MIKRETTEDRALFPDRSAVAIALIVTVVIVVGAVVWPFVAKSGSPTYVDIGQWLSGIVQPLAVFWFVLAFLLQREELKLQRRELSETRAQIMRQAEAAAGSDRSARRATYVQVRKEVLEYLRLQTIEVGKIGWPMTVQGEHIRTIAKILNNLLTAELLRTSAYEIAAGEAFRQFRDAYVQAFNVLLSMANDCEDAGSTVFVDMLRAEEQFAFYRILQTMIPGDDFSPLAQGERACDCKFPTPWRAGSITDAAPAQRP